MQPLTHQKVVDRVDCMHPQGVELEAYSRAHLQLIRVIAISASRRGLHTRWAMDARTFDPEDVVGAVSRACMSYAAITHNDEVYDLAAASGDAGDEVLEDAALHAIDCLFDLSSLERDALRQRYMDLVMATADRAQ